MELNSWNLLFPWKSLGFPSRRLPPNKNQSRVVGKRRKMWVSCLRPAADNSSLVSWNLHLWAFISTEKKKKISPGRRGGEKVWRWVARFFSPHLPFLPDSHLPHPTDFNRVPSPRSKGAPSPPRTFPALWILPPPDLKYCLIAACSVPSSYSVVRSLRARTTHLNSCPRTWQKVHKYSPMKWRKASMTPLSTCTPHLQATTNRKHF